jgi:hypothetical protein
LLYEEIAEIANVSVDIIKHGRMNPNKVMNGLVDWYMDFVEKLIKF